MSEPRLQRRLAAILAADVIGYSRLMGEDEAGTLAALKSRRQVVLIPLLRQFSGRLVKLMGDGFLVEFPSAVNAVQCALDLQKAFAAANEGYPANNHIVLRIGVNLGDVIVEGDDLYGDGVNVAARLESLAPPGGIVISAIVRDSIGNRLDLAVEDMGEQQLKNIAAPVRLFRLESGAPESGQQRLASERTRPSLAVLPFSNMSNDPEQDYFSDGITEDIITELSRFRGFGVVARNSTFKYKGKSVDIRQLARELRASHVLEGSVRRVGSRIRVTAQLIEADSGHHLWAERYDRPAEDVFLIQDDVVRTVSASVAGRVEASFAEELKTKPPASLSAYECVLKGHAMPIGDQEAQAIAMDLYTEAIRLDPTYALAHAKLALSHLHRWLDGPVGNNEELDRAYACARRAIDLDPHESVGHTAMSYIENCRGNSEIAELHARQAVALNPNRPNSIVALADHLLAAGRPQEAIELTQEAMRLDPQHPSWYWTLLAAAYFMNRIYAEAVSAIRRRTNQSYHGYAYLAAAYAYLGQKTAMQEAVRSVLRMRPDFSIRTFMAKELLHQTADREHLAEGLRRAGLPE